MGKGWEIYKKVYDHYSRYNTVINDSPDIWNDKTNREWALHIHDNMFRVTYRYNPPITNSDNPKEYDFLVVEIYEVKKDGMWGTNKFPKGQWGNIIAFKAHSFEQAKAFIDKHSKMKKEDFISLIPTLRRQSDDNI
jgi:hypothetical protein